MQELTLVNCTVIGPLASTVAVSPRSCVTLPTMRTVRPENCSRYGALMRGVASFILYSVVYVKFRMTGFILEANLGLLYWR